MTSYSHTPLEQPAPTATMRQRLTIGIPANTSAAERRFPLTPEGARAIIDRGYRILIEESAADLVHYNINAYLRQGAELCSRTEAFRCDIVIYLPTPSVQDIAAMRRGAMLLSLLSPETLSAPKVSAMLRAGITTISLSDIKETSGNRPFADILAEIDGRSAMVCATSKLADSFNGKGILLGGVAGIVPCEVTIIGAGIAGLAAARSALGMGATVKIFDDDAYALRNATNILGSGVITSSLHTRVLISALTSADVIVVSNQGRRGFTIGKELTDNLKRGVMIFDISENPGRIFPSLKPINLADRHHFFSLEAGNNVMYVNPGSTVPRTVAMALSNTLITLLDDILVCDGVTNALRLTPALRHGVATFAGRLTDRRLATLLNIPAVDINIFLPLL